MLERMLFLIFFLVYDPRYDINFISYKTKNFNQIWIKHIVIRAN